MSWSPKFQEDVVETFKQFCSSTDWQDGSDGLTSLQDVLNLWLNTCSDEVIQLTGNDPDTWREAVLIVIDAYGKDASILNYAPSTLDYAMAGIPLPEGPTLLHRKRRVERILGFEEWVPIFSTDAGTGRSRLVVASSPQCTVRPSCPIHPCPPPSEAGVSRPRHFPNRSQTSALFHPKGLTWDFMHLWDARGMFGASLLHGVFSYGRSRWGSARNSIHPSHLRTQQCEGDINVARTGRNRPRLGCLRRRAYPAVRT